MDQRTGLSRIKHAFFWRYRHFFDVILRPRLLLTLTRLRWRRQNIKAQPHGLKAPLIVSLTSYAPRFPTLLPTLHCLLMQDMKPDQVILWIDTRDSDKLPSEIRALTVSGLTIRETPTDIGPYKKIIPALKEFPKAFIVTADDDVYYSLDWLSSLVTSWSGDTKEIVCHRAHKICFCTEGLPLPYGQWQLEVPGALVATDIFPTGVGGILYPPNAFAPQVLDEETFTTVCPKADDIWLFWMARRNGCVYRKTANNVVITVWPSSQAVSLVAENLFNSGNDTKIQNMITHFGWPTVQDQSS